MAADTSTHSMLYDTAGGDKNDVYNESCQLIRRILKHKLATGLIVAGAVIIAIIVVVVVVKTKANDQENEQGQFASHHKTQVCGSQNPKVVNSTCYLCNNTCLTTDDIIDLWNKNMRLCGDSQPEHITCCLISSMKNLDKPSLDGTYKCFEAEIHQKYNTSPIQPLFDCQHGKTGERCEKLNKVPFYCKCYALDNKFHNQENMTECASIPDKPSCHTSIQGRNCMCTRLPEKETRRLTQC
ncbi:uncharacterized protein LOC132746003 isoform X3 [Ruditapes philippinarum]|uniref:uncharacterized protein LOC132746003 isoform X3 n=1 Tax=Ruditapes philippinarum TaxID=129788 RepID=UPI00295ADA10|nr:uncharacterized protein LOC132746003 isoform X3 [Ruditapes philippinarum]